MSFLRALHAQVGALCLLLTTLSLLLARLLGSPWAIIGNVSCFTAAVASDLLGLSTTRVDQGKL